MRREEAGAAATPAAVTAGQERGSNWLPALPAVTAGQERGSNWLPAPPAVAGDREILEFLTGVMRGEGEGSAQTMKAAELLGKRIGLFSERAEAAPAPVIIDDVESALRRAVERESG